MLAKYCIAGFSFFIYTRSLTGSMNTCCADGWLPFKGSCYQFYDEQKIDWNEAVMFCKNKHSELVTIETSGENLFIQHFARKLYNIASGVRNSTAFWIGASDTDIEGIWTWVSTGEELDFTAWDRGQPNTSADNKEDCIALSGAYDFTWHDGICIDRIGFPLCEKKGGTEKVDNGLQIFG